MTTVLDSKLDLIVSACARHRVSRLDVFGSVLRDDFRPGESDVDFLVEFKPLSGYERVDAYFGLLDDLREILGTRVDLVMAGAVKNRYVAADIARTKQALYAA
jgi:hypothetical protein